MKTHTRRNTKGILIKTVTAVVLVCGVYASYALYAKAWPFAGQGKSSDINLEQPSDKQKEAGAAIKTQNATTNSSSADKTTSGIGSDPSPAPTANSNSGLSTVGMNITSANVVNGTLVIRALIQYVTSTGTCELTMTGPNGAQYTNSAGIQPASASSSCKGFNVPISTLHSGNWSITIKFTDGTVAGSASKEVSI